MKMKNKLNNEIHAQGLEIPSANPESFHNTGSLAPNSSPACLCDRTCFQPPRPNLISSGKTNFYFV